MSGGDYSTGSTAWSYWTTTNATAVTTTAKDYTWRNWSDSTTGATSSTVEVWTNWNGASTNITRVATEVWAGWVSDTNIVVRQQSKAELERQQKEEAERQKARDAAAAKAAKLLLEELDADQRADFEAKKSFVVTAKSGRKYRIRTGTHGNVDVLDKDGKPEARLCVQTRDEFALPTPDVMLAQKLYIEHAEEEFLKVANRTPVRIAA